MAELGIGEAQTLYEAVNDPVIALGLKAFFREQKILLTNDLIDLVRQRERDTMKEAHYAGRIEQTETEFQELQHFALRALNEAKR